MHSENEELEKRLAKETEENNRLRADELLLIDELKRLKLGKVEPKREHFGTLNTSLERKMIRAADNC